MAIKKFSAYIAEAPAQDYVAPKDDDAEVKGYKPRSKGEEDFANMHNVEKHDYPVDVEAQFTGGVEKKERQPNNGEKTTTQGSSSVKQPNGGGDSKRSADKSQGDMKPVNSIKEGLEDNQDNPANRQHLCAKNVVHEQYGEGVCISEEHAEPDEFGHVEWYDVMFKHGLERFMPVAEMKVTKAEAHMHASKKAKARKMDEAVDLEEAREDTATQVARELKKMGVKSNAKEADIIKKIPDVLKKMGLGNNKLIKRDPDFIGDVLDSMNEEFDLIEGKVMDGLKKIVDKKSAGSVKFENGKTLKVDMTTANAMLNLHKKINDKNKAKMADQIEKSPEVFMKLMDVAFGGK